MTSKYLANGIAIFPWVQTGKTKAIARLRKTLDGHRAQLLRFSPGQHDTGLNAALEEFLKFLRTYDDRETYSEFEKSVEFSDYQRFFSPYIVRLAWESEGMSFAEVMSYLPLSGQKLGKLLGPHTRSAYARMEDALKLTDVSGVKSYVMLGCGKVPAGLFYLHDWTEIPHLCGVDNFAPAVQMAQAIVDRFALSRLNIIRADAAEFDLSPFDAIYWGHFCTPRRSVMNSIVSTARKDSIIILRDPYHTGTLITESVMPYLDPRLEVCAQSEAFSGRFMLKHYVLKLR